MQAVHSRPQGTAQGSTRSALSQAHQRALIPQSRLDFPTQRLYAIAIFGALQAFKAFDTYKAYTAPYPEQYNGAFLKWWLIDFGYLVALWIVQIPWLQFSALKTIALAFLMGILDLLLFAIPLASLTGLLMKAFFGDMLGQQLGVSRAKMVNVKDIVFNSSHILGRHTVHILPYGTAKLNPDNGFYCIPANQIGQKDIYIPIVLNNSVPRTITVSRQDFETNTQSVSDYSGRQIQRATEIGHGTQGLEYYYIRVRHPGAYKVENIVSRDGMDVRLYSRNAYVFVCPTARFSPMDVQNYCSGDKEALQLDVLGVPPLHVEYTRRINGQSSALKLDRIQPETLDSPLSRFSGGLSAADQSFFTPAYHQSYNWGASQYMSIKLNLTFEKPGEYEYQLKSVTDGAGNKVDLSEFSTQTFAVHEHPTAQMQCSATNPVKLLIGDDSVKLPIKLRGNGPWKVQYEYTSLDNENNEKKLRRLELPAAESASLPATAPGEYKLLSVTDNFCKGDILYPSTCYVVQPPLPSVQLQAFSIPSECAADSEIGMKFIAEFQGSQPFALEYRVIKQNGRKRTVVDKRREKVDRSRHMFTYLPTSSGDYIYEFTVLDDGNYRNRDPQIQPVSQTVHPQPNARFVERLRSLQSLRTCLGETMNLDVDLSGTGPFELMWTFDKQLYSDYVEGDRYTIQVPPLETPGQHVVSLIKIQDANGCAKDLEARDIVIDVRRDRPTAFFYTEDKEDALISVAEGESAKLPLRLTGEGPWKLTYRNVNKDSKPRALTLRDPNAEIQVRDVGQYELLSVEDAICKGDVHPPHITVQWVDKPKLFISEESAILKPNGVYERRAVCEGTDDAIDILFSGHGPYHANYDEYRAANGKYSYALVQSDEISSGMTKNRIALLTRQSGNYRYVFNKISDQRYQRPVTLSPPVTLEQTVHANPTVKFSSKSKWDRTVCVGDDFTSDDVGAIWLELTGQAPFTVQIGLKHQSEMYGRIITLENIETPKYKLHLENEQVTLPGRYEIQLLRVQDANGCSSAVQDEKPLVIEALDIATIVPAETCDEHCVGDTLEYSLSGIAPFTIVYQFNGHNEKVKVPSSKLSMIADKPGNLTIISIGDQRNKCRSFPKGMTKIIHPIPTSLVSGGKEIIESIREGEMVQAVVDLEGTPPFDFEWQRSEAIWDHSQKRYFKGNVLESHTVHNVEDHRYYINTSKEGVIEVVRIKDRYCQYSLPHL